MPKPQINGPWHASTPEHGDGDDACLVCHATAPAYEVLEVRGGTLAERKRRANRIAYLLNKWEVVAL